MWSSMQMFIIEIIDHNILNLSLFSRCSSWAFLIEKPKKINTDASS